MVKPGCGTCGKPKPGPYGHPSSKPASTSMSAQTQSFRLELSTGETLTVNGSMLEAQATLARLGGLGKII